MTDDVDAEGLIAQVTRPVDPRWWTRGRVIRTIRASPRLVHETFWLELEADRHPNSLSIEESIAYRGDEVIVGEQRFDHQPPLGPLTLWVREIDFDGRDASVIEHMAGNLAPAEDPLERAPLEFVDATQAEQLPESVVWSWLDRLDGKSTYGAIDRVAVQLAREDEATILGMAQGAMRLMQSLDRPDLDAVWVDDSGRRHAPAQLDRWRRGAVLAGGRAVYSAALRDGVAAQHRPPSDGSPLVPHLAAFALSKRLRRQVSISTSWSSEDGSNRESWGDLVAGDRPFAPTEEVVLQLSAAERRARDIWKEATGEDLGDESRTFFTIRYAIVDASGAREIVQFVYGDPRSPLVAAERAAADTAGGRGGRRVGPIELYNPHTSRPMSGPVFQVKRRFTGGAELYRQYYGL